jgi:hypothetical protein
VEQGERWRVLAPLPAPRESFAFASANVDGVSYLYAIGGDEASGVSDALLRYDLAADRWQAYSDKPTAVADVQAVVIGGKIYVPGGRTADGNATDVLEVYDPQLDTWNDQVAALPAPRSRYALAAVEGKLYLFGGWHDGAFADQVWQYTPDTDRWTVLGPMDMARADAGAAVLGDQIFLFGGENEQGLLDRHQRYNPAASQGNPWTPRAPLPEPRSRMAVAFASERFFVLGGGGEALSYSNALNEWQPTPPLPLDAALSGARGQMLGNSKLYIAGGSLDGARQAGLFEYLALYINLLPSTGQ